VYRSKHRGRLAVPGMGAGEGYPSITPVKISTLYVQNAASSAFLAGKWFALRNAIHIAFLNTLTMGTAFPLRNDP